MNSDGEQVPLIILMRTGLLLVAILLAALATANMASAHEPGGEARYLGNEGVLVSGAGGQVLFDAFFVDGLSYYQPIPRDVAGQISKLQAPFDRVKAVLVSHAHPDHFDAGTVLDYMRSNPDAELFAPAQAFTLLAKVLEADDPLRSRMHAIDLAPDDAPASHQLGTIEVQAAAIPHSGGARMARVQNIAFRVLLADGLTVMHLGDATTDPEAFEPQRAFWEARPLHALFPPYWFLEDADGLSLLEDLLPADQVVGIHVPIAAQDDEAGWRDRFWGDLFIQPGEARVLGAGAGVATRDKTEVPE